MDFGFARFLEMFEERFGSRATTAMLAIIGVLASGKRLEFGVARSPVT